MDDHMHVAWHRSLYARTALGFILILAIMLAVQAAIFLWLLDRRDQSTDAEHASRLERTRAISAALSRTLEQSQNLDLDSAVAPLRHGSRVFVIMKDGRVSGSTGPVDPRSIVTQLREGGEALPISWERGQYAAV